MQPKSSSDPPPAAAEEESTGERPRLDRAPEPPDSTAPASPESTTAEPASPESVTVEPTTAEPASPESVTAEPTTAEPAPTVEPASPVEPASVNGVQDVEIGRVIDGRYRVEALLGKGAVGLVYRCRHLALDKDVAIKVLRPDYAADAEVAGRLEVEAKAASAAGSPHIVETVDFGRLPDGSAYFAMEYLEGRSLGDLLESGEVLGPEEVLDLAMQIAEALEAAHTAGIVHRDLKPDNVFLVKRGAEPRFVKILDFGIAKLARAESKLTRAGHIYGTPHYMSPEQATGRDTDWRTDVYSLGVILYEMATSKVPFDADEPMAILMQHVHDEPPAMVPAAGGELVPRIESVIRKCMQKDPERRYGSMAELRDDLERLRSGLVPEAAKGGAGRSTLPPVPRSSSLWTRGVTAVAALGVLASATLGYALYTRDEPRDPEETPVHEGSANDDSPQSVPEPAPVAEEAEPPAAPERQGKPVVLIVLPADARITQEGKDLGPMPVTVHVPRGGQAEVLVQRSGYIPRRLVLKGEKPRVVVGLVEVGSQSVDAAEKAQAQAERHAADLPSDEWDASAARAAARAADSATSSGATDPRARGDAEPGVDTVASAVGDPGVSEPAETPASPAGSAESGAEQPAGTSKEGALPEALPPKPVPAREPEEGPAASSDAQENGGDAPEPRGASDSRHPAGSAEGEAAP